MQSVPSRFSANGTSRLVVGFQIKHPRPIQKLARKERYELTFKWDPASNPVQRRLGLPLLGALAQNMNTHEPAEISVVDERRYLTIMFTDLSDSTAIASQMEPETYNAILEQMRTAFVSIVRKYGGDTVRIDGDGFIFMFGYPTPFEDTARRAAEAALDIHEAIDEINQEIHTDNFPLRLHTGIHSGIVLLKAGDLTRGKYEIVGDPTNVAARICDFAAPGEIVISEESIGRSKSFFQTTKQHVLKISGRTERILLNKILGLKQAESHESNSRDSTFVGRRKALDWLNAFVARGKKNAGIALIHGEAGLGKSRLLLEFSNEMAQAGVGLHIGLCESYLGVSAYQPVDQIAKSIFRSEFGTSFKRLKNEKRSSSEACLEMAEIISSSKSDLQQTADQSKSYISAFYKLFEELQHSPILLIIDDWQWVDDASKKIIEVLGNSNTPNLKIILASREADTVFTEMNNAHVWNLSPLGSREIEKTIKSLLPGIGPFALKNIRSYSGGNPLFIEELCHAVKDSRFSANEPRHGSWLTSLIYSRFSKLPKDLAEIIKICAVIGQIVPEWLLESILGKSLTVRKLAELREYDFLHPAESAAHVRFNHGITRDVIYEMIGLEERQTLHRRVIEKLRGQAWNQSETESHEQLAYHYAQSGQVEASINHSKIAGDVALKFSALDKAQAHFKNALSLADKCQLDVGEKLELIQKYGRACVVDPSLDQLEILEMAVTYASDLADNPTIAWSEYWLGCNLYGLGFPYRSLVHFEKSHQASKALGFDKLKTQLIANRGQAYASACEYETAYELLDRAIEIKLANRSGTRASPGLAYALSSKGFALGEQGKFEQSIACFQQAGSAIGYLEHQAQTSIINQHAASCLWNGEFEECSELTDNNKTMSRKMHSRYNYAQATFMNSAINFYQTGTDTAIAKMVEATNWLIEDGIGQNLSLNFGCLAEALAQKKSWNKARIFAARCIKRARLGDKSCESQAYRALALAAQEGQTKHAPDYYINKAYKSAELRQSDREIRNNRYFENRYFGAMHNVENVHTLASFYVD